MNFFAWNDRVARSALFRSFLRPLSLCIGGPQDPVEGKDLKGLLYTLGSWTQCQDSWHFHAMPGLLACPGLTAKERKEINANWRTSQGGTADDINPASPTLCYTSMVHSVLVLEVMQDLHHRQ